MSYVNWLDIIPSALSAIATGAAALAAFGSLKVSRESKRVAEQSALAIHHGPAANLLSEVRETLTQELQSFSKLAFDVWVKWAREIEAYDCRHAGGKNPRPLRHVLTNASEMLERHASHHGKAYWNAHRSIFAIIRDGIGETPDVEYRRLLNKADGSYTDFESVFGTPRLDKTILSSQAFRWAYYQLTYRVTIDGWRKIWTTAWREHGWPKRYRAEYDQVESVLRSSLASLKAERKKLEHSVFPLETNPPLDLKYKQAMGILNGLLESGDLKLWEGHINDPHDDDLVLLVLYSMGIAFLTNRAIQTLLHEL